MQSKKTIKSMVIDSKRAPALACTHAKKEIRDFAPELGCDVAEMGGLHFLKNYRNHDATRNRRVAHLKRINRIVVPCAE